MYRTLVKLVIITLFISPLHALAWNSTDADADIIWELNEQSQPIAGKQIRQGNMSAKYTSNSTTLTDKITVVINGKTRSIPGPWSAANKTRREAVRKCMKENSSSATACGFYDYKILRISPSGNYIELIGNGWDTSMWRLIDAKTGRIVLSNDNGIEKSSWSEDRKSIAFKTASCEIGGCADKKGYFMTKPGKFPAIRELSE